MNQNREHENNDPPEQNEEKNDNSIEIVAVEEPEPTFEDIDKHVHHFFKNNLDKLDEADCLIHLSKFNKHNPKNRVSIPDFVKAVKELGAEDNLVLRIKEKTLIYRVNSKKITRTSCKIFLLF